MFASGNSFEVDRRSQRRWVLGRASRLRADIFLMVNSVLKRVGIQVNRLGSTVAERRLAGSVTVYERYGPLVKYGRFLGQDLSSVNSWGRSDLAAMLLGTYEQQLIPVLDGMLLRDPDVVVNIGCADGFYAVAMARALPNARVVAVDIDESVSPFLSKNASRNGVADQIEFRSDLDAVAFDALLGAARRPAVIMDCEGCENTLIRPATVPNLARAELLIEVHDFLDAGLSERLQERLARTHRLLWISDCARDPFAYSELNDLVIADRYLVLCEGRPETMSWLHAIPSEGMARVGGA